MKELDITKCEIVVPISSQLPESVTKKKKFSVIISVVESTNKNNENGGSSRHLERSDNVEDNKKKGISILRMIRAAIRNGLNKVVNLYTEEIVNDARDAILS